MTTMFKRLLLFSTLSTMVSYGTMRELYVATDGNDSNNGSIAAPLATIDAARAKLRTGVTDTTSTDGATEITIATWVFPNAKGAYDGIVTSSGDYFGLIFSPSGVGNPIEFRAKTFDVARGPDNSCPTGQWTHVAGVWKQGQYTKLYINGVEVVSNGSSTSGSPDMGHWYMGSDRLNGGRYLVGETENTHVYTRALSPTEIATLATDPSPGVSGATFSYEAKHTFNGAEYVRLNETIFDEGAMVYLRGGRYPINSTVTFEVEDGGEAGAPNIYKAYPGEDVILDGSKFLPTDGFSLVTDTAELARLHPDGRGRVYAATLSDASLIARMENPDAQISLDDRMLQQSRFPNIGFTFGDSVDRSTETINTDGTSASPTGAKFTPRHTPQGDWQAELNRVKKARCRGYVSADWHNETLRIHSVAADHRVTLMDGSRYGFGQTGINRPYIDNLLCEIDEPGEWYFDNIDNRLYIYPPNETITSNSVLGVWAGPDMFTMNGSHIRLENLIMQCAGNSENAFVNMYGTSNVVAGCTFRYSPPGTVSLNIYQQARKSGVDSCDFIDINNASRLYAGSVANDQISAGSCFIENSHFTQVYSKNFYGKVTAFNGAGNIFRHNLMHNHNGQTVTMSGVDHVVEFNEIFNTGIEEGDGGSFYSGASFSSWNNSFRNNFWHHIICIPGLYSRAAIFSDDGDCGEIVNDNVFYKAGDGFKVNQGAGHIGRGNVSIENIRAALVLGSYPTTMYNNNMTYLNTDPMSGDKNNILGRGMREFGIDEWDSTINSGNWNTHIHSFWRNRYPRFDDLMNKFWNDKSMRKYCSFTNTVVYANTGTSDGITGTSDVKEIGTQVIGNLSYFEDPDALNFKYNTPLPAWAADNQFELIGLYTNEFRTTMPDKDWYRGTVKARWAGEASQASGSYNPDTINDRIYYNTGKMIFGIPEDVPPVTVDLNATSYNYDVGPRFSEVLSGWGKIYPEINGDIQWIDPVSARDRGLTSGVNAANRDHVYGTAPATLEHKLANGYWQVTMNMGDSTAAHDSMRVYAEDQLMVADLDSGVNSFPYAVFTVAVRDGSLSLRFEDNGGADPEWVVGRLSLLKKGEVVDLSKDKYDYDPGPVDSDTLSGWTLLTPAMLSGTSDVYWQSTVSATDRGTSTGANNINRDFIHGTAPATLQCSVANGPWHVVMNIGDPMQDRDNVRVTMVDGGDTAVVSPAAANAGPYVHLYGTVTDGHLSLTFNDDGGGTDPEWLVNRLTLIYENGRPVADDKSATVMGGQSVGITLTGSDPDETPTFHVADQPQHGSLSGTGANRTYTADADFVGTDTFTYTARDAFIDSPPATVTITVEPNTAGVDTDGDGVTDRMEYAFGGDAANPGVQGTLPTLGPGASGMEYVYLLRGDPTLTATLMIRTNLMMGAWEIHDVQTGAGGTNTFNSITNGLPAGDDALFLKLEVE